MYMITVIVLSFLFGGLALYLSFRLLRRFGWFVAWLRGSAGVLLLLLAITIGFVAVDLSRYDELLDEKPIAALSFEEISPQTYRVNISYLIDKPSQSFDVFGDQWQVDARIIRWHKLLLALGAKPGFQLDRLSGRYYALEDEHNKPRSVFNLKDDTAMMDIWQVLQKHENILPLIEASYGSAAFLPMSDGATFQLLLSHTGLTAKPVNPAAKNAVSAWR